MFDADAWLNDKPISKYHVKIMSCTYSGWYDRRDIFKDFGQNVKPVTVWLEEHELLDRTRFDYRAVKSPLDDGVKVWWYLVFENEEDMVLYKIVQDTVLDEIIEGM